MKRIVADMMGLDLDDPQWDAKCAVLKEQVQHHVGEEESELFPTVKTLLGSRRLDELGAEMESLAESLAEEEPRRHIPEETAGAAPLE
jgi:hypothetical protein